MRAPYGEHDVAIKQRGFACQVVLNAEFNAQRSRSEEVDLGRNSELGRQQSGHVAPEADPGQATNVGVNDHQPVA
jgi:hypothetical protein